MQPRHGTYGNETLCGGVARQRFASGAEVTSSDSEDNDANDDDDECFVVQLLPFVSSMLPARVKLTSCLSDYLLLNFTNSRCTHMQ